MNFAQLHLLIVHLPVLGSFFVLFTGLYALKNTSIKALKSFYWGSVLIAITSSIAYFTGPDTAIWVKNHISNYSNEIVESHALWGRIGFSIGILGGLLGIMAISNYAQDEKPHRAIPWVLIVVMILLVLTFAYTAHLGGLIRRPDLL